jgi:hypothetical protein
VEAEAATAEAEAEAADEEKEKERKRQRKAAANAERDRAARALVREQQRALTLAECEADPRDSALTQPVLREYCRAASLSTTGSPLWSCARGSQRRCGRTRSRRPL